MPLTTIRSPPALDSFTSLADHQSQTPTSFFGAKPILHRHIVDARVLISGDQASSLSIFPAAGASAHDGVASAVPSDPAVEIAREAQPPTVAVVDVFVSSE